MRVKRRHFNDVNKFKNKPEFVQDNVGKECDKEISIGMRMKRAGLILAISKYPGRQNRERLGAFTYFTSTN